VQHGRDARVNEVRSTVRALLPGHPIDNLERLGDGLNHVAYELNGKVILRFSKEPDPERRAERIRREHDLLAVVTEVSPLPVPEPVSLSLELGCMAYLKLPGVSLLNASQTERADLAESIATELGAFHTAIHAIPVELMRGLVSADDEPLELWRREAAKNYATVAYRIPDAHHGRIEAFLHALTPQRSLASVFSHNDLGIEHVLIDQNTWTITGIIDWSDAAIVDAAYDFGLLYRDLGPIALEAALRNYRTEINDVAKLAERATFYAKCSVFEDLVYGVENNQPEYANKSLASIEWLF
jgi:aminoglycoside phosphotransferase (APT) family kinase protein